MIVFMTCLIVLGLCLLYGTCRRYLIDLPDHYFNRIPLIVRFFLGCSLVFLIGYLAYQLLVSDEPGRWITALLVLGWPALAVASNLLYMPTQNQKPRKPPPSETDTAQDSSQPQRQPTSLDLDPYQAT